MDRALKQAFSAEQTAWLAYLNDKTHDKYAAWHEAVRSKNALLANQRHEPQRDHSTTFFLVVVVIGVLIGVLLLWGVVFGGDTPLRLELLR